MVQRSANKARTQALNQLHALVLTAPEELRGKLRGLSTPTLIATCAAFRVRADDDSLPAMIRLSLRELAQRETSSESLALMLVAMEPISDQARTDDPSSWSDWER